MNNMRVLLGAAAASLAAAGAASAAEPTFTGNVALSTDYTFRGVSQTDENPALQGGIDYAYDLFYAGVWGSNVDQAGATLEIDVYAGVKPTVGPVGLDFGVIGYFYPDASDAGAELDYFEGYAKASISPAEGASLGAAVYVSPEFNGEVGTGVYTELNGSLALTEAFAVSGAVGYQSTEDDYLNGKDNFTTWNVGGTVSAYGLSFDLRYVATDLDIDIADDRAVFSIKRAF
jgi:uncharacterized protein (TIGR02001 family)